LHIPLPIIKWRFLPGLFAFLPAHFVLWHFYPDISEENQLLEWLQVIALFSAFTIYAISAFRLRHDAADFSVAASLSMLMLAFGLRELDIREFGSSNLVAAIERDLQVIKIVLGLALILFLMVRSPHIFRSLNHIFAKKAVILTIIGGLFLLASAPFDDKAFNLAPDLSRLIEEALELQACLLLFAASVTELPHRPRTVHRPALMRENNRHS
jgi:hypothetical protein